ncbi:hypothetical protein ASZ90_001392 [hydrocarbon metagenome]|uniref:Uncharacterized protein n=1 Tax=hydrocarbon metagenome TaxID=938273 RepID=A0A0W8G6G1_9ZZZZ
MPGRTWPRVPECGQKTAAAQGEKAPGEGKTDKFLDMPDQRQ